MSASGRRAVAQRTTGVRLADFAAGTAPAAEIVWEITARLCLLGDTHIGAADDTHRYAADGDVDRAIDRDPVDGHPRLRATTLAGLLRHHLAARLGPGADPAVSRLFGEPAPARGDTASTRSALDLDDAFAELPGEAGVAVRAGNRVDPGSGAAAPGALWQMEILPAGTRFTLPLRLWVTDPGTEGQLLALTVLAADGLTASAPGPGIAVGARTARGYGSVRADTWHARRHDLRTPHGWAAWYAPTWAERWERAHHAVTDPAAAGPEAASLGALLTARMDTDVALAVAAGSSYHATMDAHGADRRHRDELTLTLELGERPTEAFLDDPAGRLAGAGPLRPGLIMVGDVPAPESLGEADRTHRWRPRVTGDGAVEWRPTLGDTALFALFKRLSRRLIRDVSGESHHAVEDWPEDSPGRRLHAHWWGSDVRAGETPTSSRIRLRHAAELMGGTTQRTRRVAIDALFGDAVDSHLFTHDVHAGGRATVILDIRQPDDVVRGLLALIVRELRTAPLDAVGGGSGIGNGRLTVTEAVLTHYGPACETPTRVDLVAAIDNPHGPERATVTPWLDTLRAAVTPVRSDDANSGVIL